MRILSKHHIYKTCKNTKTNKKPNPIDHEEKLNLKYNTHKIKRAKAKPYQIWKYIGNKTEAKEPNLNAATITKSANLINY